MFEGVKPLLTGNYTWVHQPVATLDLTESRAECATSGHERHHETNPWLRWWENTETWQRSCCGWQQFRFKMFDVSLMPLWNHQFTWGIRHIIHRYTCAAKGRKCISHFRASVPAVSLRIVGLFTLFLDHVSSTRYTIKMFAWSHIFYIACVHTAIHMQLCFGEHHQAGKGETVLSFWSCHLLTSFWPLQLNYRIQRSKADNENVMSLCWTRELHQHSFGCQGYMLDWHQRSHGCDICGAASWTDTSWTYMCTSWTFMRTWIQTVDSLFAWIRQYAGFAFEDPKDQAPTALQAAI